MQPLLKKRIRLCKSVDHFTQSIPVYNLGDNWSCGYRNIQILCSSLVQNDKYRPRLFDGTGRIPEVAQIQKYIELAWDDGFDRPGREHFGGCLSGTCAKIGAAECATLLRYFGR